MSLSALHTCPSCARSVSPHDARCPDCRQVLGLDNVCEQCHALAPAMRQGVRIVCTACDGVRTRRPNTVVVSARELRWLAGWERFRVRVYGGAAAATALFGLLLSALLGRFEALQSVAVGIALMCALVVTLLWRRITRVRARRDARDRFMLEQRLLGFAHKRGVVTAEMVAHHLSVPVAAADAMLDELVRVGRADMDVTDRGEITFSLHAPRDKSAVRPRASVADVGARALAARRKQRQST